MANTKQAKKRVRQSNTHNLRNVAYRSMYRTSIKKVISQIEAKNLDKAKEEYALAVPVIDKMVTKGIIHRNKAARHKSRLSAKIKSLAK